MPNQARLKRLEKRLPKPRPPLVWAWKDDGRITCITDPTGYFERGQPGFAEALARNGYHDTPPAEPAADE